MEFRSGMHRNSSDDGFLCLTSEKLGRLFNWIMLDLCFLGNKGEALLFSATYAFPCSLWSHSSKMEIIASCCNGTPSKSAKIRARNGNVTNGLQDSTPPLCMFFTRVAVYKSCGVLHTSRRRGSSQLQCWRKPRGKHWASLTCTALEQDVLQSFYFLSLLHLLTPFFFWWRNIPKRLLGRDERSCSWLGDCVSDSLIVPPWGGNSLCSSKHCSCVEELPLGRNLGVSEARRAAVWAP